MFEEGRSEVGCGSLIVLLLLPHPMLAFWKLKLNNGRYCILKC